MQRNPTELEEEIAKTLSTWEQDSTGDLQKNLRLTFIAAAETVEYTMANDEVSKYVLVRIPYRSLQFYRKISNELIDHLEEKFNWPVIVVANRKIQSKRGKLMFAYVVADAPKIEHFPINFIRDNREDSPISEETKIQNSQGCPGCLPH